MGHRLGYIKAPGLFRFMAPNAGTHDYKELTLYILQRYTKTTKFYEGKRDTILRSEPIGIAIVTQQLVFFSSLVIQTYGLEVILTVRFVQMQL